MNKVFKIKKNMEYSLREYSVYSVLACYTDKNQVSHISREILSHLSGVNDLDTISKYTSKFEKDNLLKKTYKFSETGKRIVEYKILEPTKDYILVTNQLFSGNPNLIGFLCLLAQYKIGNTNRIELTNKALIEKLNVSKPTFNKYMKLALLEGCISKTSKGYLLSEDIFPIVKKDNLTEKDKQTIDSLKGDNSKLGKQIKWFLSLPEEEQTHSLFNEILANLIKNNPKINKDNFVI